MSTIIETFANKYGINADKVIETLKATCLTQAPQFVTEDQIIGFLTVALQYNLNPFSREIYAVDNSQGGITPVVGIDGWISMVNSHDKFDGIEFNYSDKVSQFEGARLCPDWIECSISRKDRAKPIIIREYLDELYRPAFSEWESSAWQTHTKRQLRHKTLIQTARVAFGYGGFYDPDEAVSIAHNGEQEQPEVEAANPTAASNNGSNVVVKQPIKPNLTKDSKAKIDEFLVSLIDRVASTGAWAAAAEYIEGRYEHLEREYALNCLEEEHLAMETTNATQV